MKSCRVLHHKCLLGFFNIVLLFCGVVVLTSGFYLFTDQKKLLISSLLVVSPDDSNPLGDLKHPLFVYIACCLTILGMVVISTSFVGCCISLLNIRNNCCLLAFYFTMILLLLLLKLLICVVITIWPKLLGLKMNASESVKVLQASYGVPGYEKYTVGMDYAQTFLDCCAINDSINYDTSLWRLQSFGKKELSVPLTCCTLMNKFEPLSYLDPMPINITTCQSIDPNEFLKSRHSEGCLEKIEYWYREHYIVLLCGGLVLAMVEFFVLLSVVLNCKNSKKSHQSQRISPIKLFNEEHAINLGDSFRRNTTRENIYQEDFLSVTPEIREIFVQPVDLNKPKYPPTKFKGNNYRLSGHSYLI